MADFSGSNKRERIENDLAALWGHDSVRYESGGDREAKADNVTEAYAYLFWQRYATDEETDAGFAALSLGRKRLFALKARKADTNMRIHQWRETVAVAAAKATVIDDDDEND